MLDACLKGVRVLDLSQYIPGPFATQLLADLGAEVIKVEPPAGDPMRSFIAEDGDGLSPFYKQVNAGKTVVRADLKSPEGRLMLAELLGRADVLLESFRPGVMERLGFGGERLQQLNRRLIHCALSGFGQTGPYRLRAGHDLTYLAITGALNATGTAETPAIPFPPVADHAGAMQAVIAILGGLLRRGRTGQGAHLDVSLFESALSWQTIGLTAARRPGTTQLRARGLLTGGAACYQIYTTSDGGHVALAAIEEKFWGAFCAAVERPGWLCRQHDPLPQEELIAEVRELFAGRSRREWEQLFGEVDCCFEPVLEHSEAPFHPQVRERQLLRHRPGDDPVTDVLFAAWLDGLPPRSRRPLREVTTTEASRLWGACAAELPSDGPRRGGVPCPAP